MRERYYLTKSRAPKILKITIVWSHPSLVSKDYLERKLGSLVSVGIRTKPIPNLGLPPELVSFYLVLNSDISQEKVKSYT